MNLPRWLASPAPKQAQRPSIKKIHRRTAIRAPVCIGCGQSMQFTRIIPRVRLLAELRCYECRRCRLGVTEEYAA